MAVPDPTLSGGPDSSVPTRTAEAKRPSKGRSAAVIVCLVLAALLTTPAAIAYWGQRTLNDTTRYVNTVGPLVDSPEVQDAIATKVTDTIQDQVDIEALLNDVFSGVITDRPRLQRLVGPLSGAINSLIDRQVREFLASDAFADLWTAANTRAQQTLQRVLSGDQTGAVSLQGEQIVLDVSQVIDQVKQRLVDRGLTILQNVPVPNVDKQIVLVEAPQVKQLRTIYAFANPVAKWLIVVVAGLYLLALVLSRRRPRTAVIIGALLAANALLMALALTVGRQLFIDALAGTTFGPASAVFYDTLLSYLERGRQVFLRLGLAIVVIGWFAGPNKSGTAVRAAVRDGLEGVGAALANGPVGTAGRWVAANARWLRVAIGLLGAVVLLWGNNISQGRLFWSLALVALLLVVVQLLVGAGRAAAASRPVPPAEAVAGTAN
ncbi:hypothetical protein ACIA58_22980 [Kribbella sp. NPDC051586]|uniref:hypothetical protein n=1 Tax=Kribbella sp. NPDC051586 TaxID=3364118 RepID=UPI0037B9B99D